MRTQRSSTTPKSAHRSTSPWVDPYLVTETTLTLQQLRKVRRATKRVHVVQRLRDEVDAA